MALVAETLVEEWINRKGYFTIRGIKTGSGEIDLLAASFQEPDALHVEVPVSANPIGYIGRDASGSYVKKRTPEELKAGAEDWFMKKFQGSKGQVARRREELCPDRHWHFMLVYGNLKYPEELLSIEDCGVEVRHIGKILEELRDHKGTFATSSEASGVAEMFRIFCKEQES
jgi:Holliday junction resolvase-like predicted endonuclease